jgi:DnaJ-class molecular chaperone with C-terminal Zn finger domain
MCSVCNGYFGCPCCSPEPSMSTCPECNGEGFTHYDANGDIISQEDYDLLPSGERSKEPCEYCEGTGEIEYSNEPDYDNYDE